MKKSTIKVIVLHKNTKTVLEYSLAIIKRVIKAPSSAPISPKNASPITIRKNPKIDSKNSIKVILRLIIHNPARTVKNIIDISSITAGNTNPSLLIIGIDIVILGNKLKQIIDMKKSIRVYIFLSPSFVLERK